MFLRVLHAIINSRKSIEMGSINTYSNREISRSSTKVATLAPPRRKRIVFVMLIALIVLAYPYLLIAHLFYPITWLGKNVYVMAPAILAFALLIIVSRSLSSQIQFLFAALVTTAIIIYLIREAAYSEQRNILDFRYVVTGPAFLLLAQALPKEKSAQDRLASVIVFSCLLQAAFGIAHAYLFSDIQMVSIEGAYEIERDLEITREDGTLGASIYANFILSGLFLLIWYPRPEIWFRRNGMLTGAMFALIFYGITLSGSRYPSIVGAIVGVIALVFSIRRIEHILYWVFLIVVAVGIALSNIAGSIIYADRSFDDLWIRGSKAVLGLEIIFENWMHFAIGAPTEYVQSASNGEGLLVSDNSYILMSLQFGTLFAIGWFMFLFKLMARGVRGKVDIALVTYFALAIGVTNSILWEPWLFVFFLTFSLIGLSQQVEREGKNVALRGFHRDSAHV